MASFSAAQRTGTGDPIVLIHGIAGAWRAWDAVGLLLADRFDVLAVSLPGHEDAPTCLRELRSRWHR